MSDDALLLAYLAGIVDGEGTVAVHRDGANRARFVIEVKMTERLVIELLSKRFGGVIVNRKPGGRGLEASIPLARHRKGGSVGISTA